jgi:hypothetical protein
MIRSTSRRRLVAAALGAAATGGMGRGPACERKGPVIPAGARGPDVIVTVEARETDPVPFRREGFGTVGVYDADWLVEPEFSMLLDNLAASPQAFHGVRFFGVFTTGTTELFTPETGGTVWRNPDAPIDFSKTFEALEALTRRELVPFVVFGMFPAAVSDSPIRPPREWHRWKTLVRTFLEELAEDPRFGPDRIAAWWFEAWNEPNQGRFWDGTEAAFHDLYRATSEAVAEVGLPIRLGGPAIAYKPQEHPDYGAPWMERFLRFISASPELQCDFVSLHRKGTVGNDPPDPRRLHEAALTTVEQALTIDPDRFSRLVVVNNEADEKVGFEVPYPPRSDHRNAAWLGAVVALHGTLAETYRREGIRFLAAADNANLQLIQAPFDGRRSIMTLTGASSTDLLKVPAYGVYEMIRLLGDHHASVVAGDEHLVPASDLYHVATRAETHCASLITYYPEVDAEPASLPTIDYEVGELPWDRVNVALFQIDRHLSNAHTAAGGSAANSSPVPNPHRLGAIRHAQELAVSCPIARGVAVQDGVLREHLALEPYTTVCLWITPVNDTEPAPPSWLTVELHDGNVVLRWEPNEDPWFYTYEVFLLRDGTPADRLTPEPLRSAMWIDTAPPAGRRSYGVRSVTASGITCPIARGEVVVP